MISGGRLRAAGERRDYRGYLDGARAIAVLLVVAFHSGVDRAVGGFVGVDLFFVLSGYLVTGLIIGELDETGTLSFPNFYARRIRRLIPMALLVLVAAGVVFAVLSPPLVVSEAKGSFAAAFVYVANWWFISEATDYIGSDIESSPILHFWSLAIEEQFYFAWPILMVGASRLARRWGGWRPVALLAAAAAMVSLVVALRVGADNVDRAYYGTDTRAYQLLIGAVLAMLPTLAARWARHLAPVGGAGALLALLVLATDLFDLSPITRGAGAAMATAVLLLSLESGHAPAMAKGLSWGPLVAVGKISYAIYLWHLPVMYVLRDTTDISDLEMLALATPVSIALSVGSARLFENPIRYSTRLRPVPRGVIAGGLALSLVGAVLFVPIALDPDTTTTIRLDSPEDASAAGTDTDKEPVELEIDWEAIRNDRSFMPECRPADPSECTVVDGDDRHVLLIGDSHAEVWAAAFVPFAEEMGFTFSIAWSPRCSWHLDAMVVIAQEIREACFDRQHEWIDEIVPALDPDTVLLVHRAMFDPARPFFATPVNFLAGADVVVETLRARGTEVVIVEPLPITAPANDPLACLSEGRPAVECSFDATPTPTILEERYRDLATQPGVVSLDLDHLACPSLPRCDVVVDGHVVWRDHSHMTATYAATLPDELAAAGLGELLATDP